MIFGHLLGWYTMYTFLGALAPDRILRHAKFTYAFFLYWQHYCTALQQRGQPNFAVWYKEWNYQTFAEGTTYIWLGGHTVGHRPTF